MAALGKRISRVLRDDSPVSAPRCVVGKVVSVILYELTQTPSLVQSGPLKYCFYLYKRPDMKFCIHVRLGAKTFSQISYIFRLVHL